MIIIVEHLFFVRFDFQTYTFTLAFPLPVQRNFVHLVKEDLGTVDKLIDILLMTD